jgi:hypothetical protein
MTTLAAPRHTVSEPVQFVFAPLPNEIIRQTFARLPHEAVRVLWLLAHDGGFDGVARCSVRSLMCTLSLSREQTKYALRALQRENILERRGHRFVVRFVRDGATRQLGFTRWSMEGGMLDVVRKLTGSQLKVLTVLQSLTQGRPGWWGVRTATLLQLTGLGDPAFRMARARLVQAKLISMKSRPRHPTEYLVHQSPDAPGSTRVDSPSIGRGNRRDSAVIYRLPRAPNRRDPAVPTPVEMAGSGCTEDNTGSQNLSSLRERRGKAALTTSITPAHVHQTLHIGLRLLGVSPVSPASAFGQRICAAIRARGREGFTAEQLVTVARWAGTEFRTAAERGEQRFVRKLRKLLYVWGSEFPDLLAEATDAPMAPEIEAAAKLQAPIRAARDRAKTGAYAITDPVDHAAWRQRVEEGMAEGRRLFDERCRARELAAASVQEK